jgi:hypothetical protein
MRAIVFSTWAKLSPGRGALNSRKGFEDDGRRQTADGRPLRGFVREFGGRALEIRGAEEQGAAVGSRQWLRGVAAVGGQWSAVGCATHLIPARGLGTTADRRRQTADRCEDSFVGLEGTRYKFERRRRGGQRSVVVNVAQEAIPEGGGGLVQ